MRTIAKNLVDVSFVGTVETIENNAQNRMAIAFAGFHSLPEYLHEYTEHNEKQRYLDGNADRWSRHTSVDDSGKPIGKPKSGFVFYRDDLAFLRLTKWERDLDKIHIVYPLQLSNLPDLSICDQFVTNSVQFEQHSRNFFGMELDSISENNRKQVKQSEWLRIQRLQHSENLTKWKSRRILQERVRFVSGDSLSLKMVKKVIPVLETSPQVYHDLTIETRDTKSDEYLATCLARWTLPRLNRFGHELAKLDSSELNIAKLLNNPKTSLPPGPTTTTKLGQIVPSLPLEYLAKWSANVNVAYIVGDKKWSSQNGGIDASIFAESISDKSEQSAFRYVASAIRSAFRSICGKHDCNTSYHFAEFVNEAIQAISIHHTRLIAGIEKFVSICHGLDSVKTVFKLRLAIRESEEGGRKRIGVAVENVAKRLNLNVADAKFTNRFESKILDVMISMPGAKIGEIAKATGVSSAKVSRSIKRLAAINTAMRR